MEDVAPRGPSRSIRNGLAICALLFVPAAGLYLITQAMWLLVFLFIAVAAAVVLGAAAVTLRVRRRPAVTQGDGSTG